MAKNKQIFLQDFRSKPISYIIQILGVVIILLNMWLATKLYPLAKSVDEVVAQVNAAKDDIASLQEASKDHMELFLEVKAMDVKIDTIITRLDRIDTRLSKHLGI